MSIIQPFKPTVVELKDSELYQLILEHLVPFTEMSKKWDAFVESLKHTNRFFPTQEFAELFSKFELFEETLPKGTKLYRARILNRDLYNYLDIKNSVLSGLPAKLMSAPPPGSATTGRANPKGISYLYLADSPETACAEVRPIRDDCISVSSFSILNDLKVVNLHKELSEFDDSNLERTDVAFFDTLRDAFMRPYKAHDEENYLATQYIASYLHHKGYDGIKYHSAHNSSDDAYSIVLFDQANAKCTSRRGKVYTCLSTSLSLQNTSIPDILNNPKQDIINVTADTDQYMNTGMKIFLDLLSSINNKSGE